MLINKRDKNSLKEIFLEYKIKYITKLLVYNNIE
jgi:hypothetical protein